MSMSAGSCSCSGKRRQLSSVVVVVVVVLVSAVYSTEAKRGLGQQRLVLGAMSGLFSSMSWRWFRASAEQEPVVIFSCVLGGLGAHRSPLRPSQAPSMWCTQKASRAPQPPRSAAFVSPPSDPRLAVPILPRVAGPDGHPTLLNVPGPPKRGAPPTCAACALAQAQPTLATLHHYHPFHGTARVRGPQAPRVTPHHCTRPFPSLAPAAAPCRPIAAPRSGPTAPSTAFTRPLTARLRLARLCAADDLRGRGPERRGGQLLIRLPDQARLPQVHGRQGRGLSRDAVFYLRPRWRRGRARAWSSARGIPGAQGRCMLLCPKASRVSIFRATLRRARPPLLFMLTG